MKKLLTILIFFSWQPTHAQNSIKYLETLAEKSFEQIDEIVSKSNFKIHKSNAVQSTSDSSLYGLEAGWINSSKDEIIYLQRMMDYTPVIRQKDSSEAGKVKVLKVTVTLIIKDQRQAESIVNSLKLSKYKNISGAIPIGNGLEIDYESDNYELTYKKMSDGENHVLIYYFILRKKTYSIIYKKIYPKN